MCYFGIPFWILLEKDAGAKDQNVEKCGNKSQKYQKQHENEIGIVFCIQRLFELLVKSRYTSGLQLSVDKFPSALSSHFYGFIL